MTYSPRSITPWQDRFWKYLTPGSQDECWEWQGARNEHGYGRLNAGGRHGRTLKAHRASYEIHHGVEPGDLDVCHHCDNPPCCNPAHLYLGTAKDNAADMVARGRHGNTPQKGQVVTPEQVIAIRELAAAGESYEALAAKFSLGEAYVGMLANGYFRRDIGGPATKRRGNLEHSDEEIRRLRERIASGESQKALAAEYDLPVSYVSLITSGSKRASAGGPLTHRGRPI